MKEKVIALAKKLHEQKVNEAKYKADIIRKKLLEVPEINKAYIEYMNIISNCIKDRKDPYLPSQSAYQKYLGLLSKYGYDDTFGYKPYCSKCNDEGMINGKVCDCFYQEYLNALKIVCEIDKKAPYSFKDSDLSIVEDARQKTILEKLYPLMQKFVDKYPDVTKCLITISGTVGTGKSFLASSIARAAVEKGQTVKFMSAYEFNSYMISCHTSSISIRNEMMSDILTADYLIIDDLGTEPLTKNVTVEYLLLVLNERTINKKATIITTNLDVDNISYRYGERISSRMMDKANSLVFPIKGKDLRKK